MINKLFPFLLCVLIALSLIFYQFPVIPDGLTHDEVEFAKLAASLNKQPYTPYSFMATGHSTLYFYIILLSFKIFGANIFSLRFPSALFGVLNPILMYLLILYIFKNSKFFKFQTSLPPSLLALIGSLVITGSRWYLNFARFSFEATLLIFFELLSVLFITYYIKNNNSKYVIFSGFFAGLAYNSYTPGRIFFILPVLVIYLYTNKLRYKSLMKFLLVFLIVSLPLNIFLIKNGDTRIYQQSFLSNNNLSIGKKLNFLGQNIQKTALMFSFTGDVNGRHNYPGKPALNPIYAVLFYIGLITALKNIRRPVFFLLLCYSVLSLIPTLLTYPWENPNMLRTITLICPISVLSVISFNSIINRFGNQQKYLAVFFLLLILFGGMIYEIRTYFLYQQMVFIQVFDINKNILGTIKL